MCCLIGLDVTSSEQISPHRSHYRRQQFANRHHPAAHSARLMSMPASRRKMTLLSVLSTSVTK
jgi:hypothetical protein